MEHNWTEELVAAVSSFENHEEQQEREAFARSVLNDEERPSLVPPPALMPEEDSRIMKSNWPVRFSSYLSSPGMGTGNIPIRLGTPRLQLDSTLSEDPPVLRYPPVLRFLDSTSLYSTSAYPLFRIPEQEFSLNVIADPHDGANHRERYQWPPSDLSVKTFVKDACSEMQKKFYELGRNLGQELFGHEDILSTAAGHVSPRLGKFNKELMKVMNVFGSLGDLVYSRLPRRQLLIRIAELTREGLDAVTELVSVNTEIIGKVKEDVSGSVQKYLEKYTSSIQCWMPAFLEQRMRTFIRLDWSK